MQSSSRAVLAVDLFSRVIYANHAAEQMTGRCRPELLGLPLARLFTIIKVEMLRVPATATRVASGARSGTTMSTAWVLSGREQLWVRLRFSEDPIIDRTGGLAGIIMVFEQV